jgi:hypothetical protein
MHLIFMFWRVLPTLAHVPFVSTVTERICDEHMIITRFVMNIRLICYLPLNTIDEFLVSRFIDVKRV